MVARAGCRGSCRARSAEDGELLLTALHAADDETREVGPRGDAATAVVPAVPAQCVRAAREPAVEERPHAATRNVEHVDAHFIGLGLQREAERGPLVERVRVDGLQ